MTQGKCRCSSAKTAGKGHATRGLRGRVAERAIGGGDAALPEGLPLSFPLSTFLAEKPTRREAVVPADDSRDDSAPAAAFPLLSSRSESRFAAAGPLRLRSRDGNDQWTLPCRKDGAEDERRGARFDARMGCRRGLSHEPRRLPGSLPGVTRSLASGDRGVVALRSRNDPKSEPDDCCEPSRDSMEPTREPLRETVPPVPRESRLSARSRTTDIVFENIGRFGSSSATERPARAVPLKSAAPMHKGRRDWNLKALF